MSLDLTWYCTQTDTVTAYLFENFLTDILHSDMGFKFWEKDASGRQKVISHEEILFCIHFVISVKPQIEWK
jgi:dimeric dUTPase (all-alpha-NTP-PPase superfamily)